MLATKVIIYFSRDLQSYTSQVQYTLDLRKPDLRKNLDLRMIVATTDFLVHKLFDLRKIFYGLMFDLRKIFSQKVEKIGTFWQF